MKQPLSYCVIPAAVKKKLTMAKKNRQTVYLYGPAGFGKTLVVREFLKSQRYLYIILKTSRSWRSWYTAQRSGSKSSCLTESINSATVKEGSRSSP